MARYKYKKTGDTVEAGQFLPDRLRGEWPRGICTVPHDGSAGPAAAHIHMPSGAVVPVQASWWVAQDLDGRMTGVEGQWFQISPEYFPEAYEPA